MAPSRSQVYDQIRTYVLTDIQNAMRKGGFAGNGSSLSGAPAGTYAPVTAGYLVTALDPTLQNERAFSPTASFAVTDAGPGGAYTFGIDFANPSATIGLTAVNGSSLKPMRADAAPALSQSIAPTWSASHTFGAGLAVSGANTLTFGGDVTMNRSAANMLAFGADDSLGTSSFTSGFSGSGWRVNYSGGFYNAEFDSLVVRGSMRVYELLIQKIRSGNGSYLFAPGGRVKSVSGGPTYSLEFDSDHGLASNGTTQKDIVRAQKFDLALGGVYTSVLQIESIIDTVTLTATVISGAAPQATYEYVRIGNTGDTNRQGGVYITSDDTNAPYIDIYDGVASAADWGSATKSKVRLGKLTGSYGVVGNYYGIGLGDYSGGNYLKYDTNGDFEMVSGDNAIKVSPTGLRIGLTTGSGWTGVAPSDILFQTNPLTNTGTVAGMGVARQSGGGPSSTYFAISLDDSGLSRTNTLNLSSTYTGAGTASIALVSDPSTESITATADTIALTGAVTATSLNVGSATGATSGQVRAVELYLGSSSDVRLYRSAADMLRTPDGLTVDAGLNVGTGSGAGTGSIVASGGLNVGTASGASAGYIKLSGYIQSQSGALVLNPAASGNVDVFSSSSSVGLRVMDTTYSTTQVQLYNNGDGYFAGKMEVVGNLTGSSWSAATMDASWSTSTASGGPLALASKKFGDMVFVRGRVRRTGTGQTIGTLVSGHRPSGSIYRTAVSHDGSGNYSTVNLRLQSSGVLTIEPSPGTNPADIDCSMEFSTNS